jgi:hypothetical protein
MNMGLGLLGNANLIIKRKFRWTFEVQRSCRGSQLNVPANFVKVAARPNLQIEETELNYLNAKTWIPGKASWQTISVTYYDVAAQENLNLWNWLASVYNFAPDANGASNPTQGSQRQDYAGVGLLTMYDGCGTQLERWTLTDLWPTEMNFGELDYASSDEATIELTLRYSNAQYQSFCPAFVPTGCCSPCGTS